MPEFTSLKKILDDVDSAIVTTHTYPDGDAIGSSVAFINLLKRLGKKARSVNPSPVPRIFQFLDRPGRLEVYSDAARPFFRKAGAIFILDTSTNDRLGPIHELIEALPTPRVCIDHHPGNTVEADCKIVDTGACSTAQIVYELFREYGVDIDAKTAEAMYAAIHTDTVSFNFLGVNATTHEIVADLLRRGVNPKKTWLRIYGNDSPGFLRLAGLTLSRLAVSDDGRLAWLCVRERDWRRFGVDPEETESFTRYPLTIGGIGVVAVFCEEGRRRVRVSLRALDDTDVGRIARDLGGGGHRTSAGVTIGEPFNRVVGRVLGKLKRD